MNNPRRNGWYTVRHFIEDGTMPGSGVLRIIEWRTAVIGRQKPGDVTLEIPATLHRADWVDIPKLTEKAAADLQIGRG